MTIKLFRNFVKLVIVLDLGWFLAGIFLLKNLPPELAAYVDADMVERKVEGLRFFLFSSLEVFLLVCWFVNLIGIYRLRRRSRSRFLIIHGILLSFELIGGPSVVHPLVQALNDLSEIGHGLLIALMYWSPIAPHFNASRKEIANTE
jgi:hypothetical protein